MKNKLELFYFEECPYCQIVLSAIRANKLESQVKLCNTRENSEYRDYHVKVTGRTTVPCLYIDGRPMFESRDIANWLTQYAQESK